MLDFFHPDLDLENIIESYADLLCICILLSVIIDKEIAGLVLYDLERASLWTLKGKVPSSTESEPR